MYDFEMSPHSGSSPLLVRQEKPDFPCGRFNILRCLHIVVQVCHWSDRRNQTFLVEDLIF